MASGEEATTEISNIDLADEAKENGTGTANIGPTEERRQEIISEITKLEDEIKTLKQALVRKETQLSNLRTELGDTRWAKIQNSVALQKSKQVLADASTKTSQAFKNVGNMTANKWQEIKDSPRYQNVSERFWNTTGAVKAKLVGAPENADQKPNVDTKDQIDPSK